MLLILDNSTVLTVFFYEIIKFITLDKECIIGSQLTFQMIIHCFTANLLPTRRSTCKHKQLFCKRFNRINPRINISYQNKQYRYILAYIILT